MFDSKPPKPVYACNDRDPHNPTHSHDVTAGKTGMHVTLHGRTEYTEHADIESALARLGRIAMVNNLHAETTGELIHHAPDRSYHGTTAGQYSIHTNEGN